MSINAPLTAPQWGHDLAGSAQKAIDALPQVFVSSRAIPVAQLSAAFAAANPYKFAIVSDGAANKHVAQSDGIIWRYLEGTAV